MLQSYRIFCITNVIYSKKFRKKKKENLKNKVCSWVGGQVGDWVNGSKSCSKRPFNSLTDTQHLNTQLQWKKSADITP